MDRGEFSLGAVIINVSWGNFAAFVKSPWKYTSLNKY
jgi:hypothetical protein